MLKTQRLSKTCRGGKDAELDAATLGECAWFDDNPWDAGEQDPQRSG
jgi:hypothetical protein